MKQETKEKLFKNMEFDTYKRLRTISSLGSNVAIISPVLIQLSENLLVDLLLVSSIALSEIYYFATNINDRCEKYTKDGIQLLKLYKEFLQNYNKLNNTLNLVHPVEIYEMFNYMLYKGFLSKDGKFIFDDEKVVDERSFLGLNIMSGQGVCRHIATMLSDIYNEMNINSCTCTAYYDSNQLLSKKTIELIALLENNLKEETNEIAIIEIERLLDTAKKLKNDVKPNFEPIKKNTGNHLITLASKDDIGYILDPTNKAILKKDTETKSRDILKSTVISSELEKMKLCKSRGEYDKKRNILSLPNSSEYEDEIIINRTNKICKDNADLLEKFRMENKELYEEIDNGLSKIRKK